MRVDERLRPNLPEQATGPTVEEHAGMRSFARTNRPDSP